MAELKLTRKRKDLKGLGVPIGENEYLKTIKLVPYRWVGEQFQIHYNGDWKNACSIDFEF